MQVRQRLMIGRETLTFYSILCGCGFEHLGKSGMHTNRFRMSLFLSDQYFSVKYNLKYLPHRVIMRIKSDVICVGPHSFMMFVINLSFLLGCVTNLR